MFHDNPDDVFVQIGRNRVILATIVAWLFAQTLKVLLGVIRERRFNFRWFVGSGGMPSSHAAFASCMAASIGILYGFDSGLFAVALVFAMVTMFDAQGVRRQSGQQAEALNRILDDLYAHRGIQADRIKELFGHNPNEVFAGAAIGVIFAIIFHS